jgi:hypothetical protein
MGPGGRSGGWPSCVAGRGSALRPRSWAAGRASALRRVPGPRGDAPRRSLRQGTDQTVELCCEAGGGGEVSGSRRARPRALETRAPFDHQVEPGEGERRVSRARRTCRDDRLQPLSARARAVLGDDERPTGVHGVDHRGRIPAAGRVRPDELEATADERRVDRLGPGRFAKVGVGGGPGRCARARRGARAAASPAGSRDKRDRERGRKTAKGTVRPSRHSGGMLEERAAPDDRRDRQSTAARRYRRHARTGVIGRGGGIRTRNLVLPKHVRCRCATPRRCLAGSNRADVQRRGMPRAVPNLTTRGADRLTRVEGHCGSAVPAGSSRHARPLLTSGARLATPAH